MKTEESFSESVTAYQTVLRSFALKLTRDMEGARDLTQDTILKAFMNKEKFQSGTNLRAWLYTIMKNIFINKYRRAMRSSVFNDPTEEQYFINSTPLTNRNEGESELIMEDIGKAMGDIRENLRTPFMMSYKGYKYDEIASMLNVPLGTVKVRIHNARKELMSRLKDYDPNKKNPLP